MTVLGLWWACTKAILRGGACAEVLFDTEAQCFGCHFVPVDGGHLGGDEWLGIHGDGEGGLVFVLGTPVHEAGHRGW